MNRFKWMVLIGTLALMAVTAGSLAWLKQHHRLGPPGLIHQPTTNGVVVAMDLPAQVGEFDSTNLPTPASRSGVTLRRTDSGRTAT
jgi:hypothetical protein